MIVTKSIAWYGRVHEHLFFYPLRELWHLPPCPDWPTPPNSQGLTRSASTRQAAGKARRAASICPTRPATSPATNMRAHTRRKSRANHNKNPCESSPCSINRQGSGKKKKKKKHNRILFAISVCLYASFIFCERDFRFLRRWRPGTPFTSTDKRRSRLIHSSSIMKIIIVLWNFRQRAWRKVVNDNMDLSKENTKQKGT